MDVIDIYAIATGGLYGIILFVNFVTCSISFLQTYLLVIILRHMIYPFFYIIIGFWVLGPEVVFYFTYFIGRVQFFVVVLKPQIL